MKKQQAVHGSSLLESVNIRNDLEKLIPVGTLNFYGLPDDVSPLAGMDVGNRCNSEWKWLDIEHLYFLCKDRLSELVKHLRFLVLNSYVVATYMVVKVHIKKGYTFNYFTVRIYSIPSDIMGARFINDIRKNLVGFSSIEKSYGKIWPIFVNMLDYSEYSWFQRPNITIKELLKRGLFVNPCQNYKVPLRFLDKSNQHIKRWLSHQPYYPMDAVSPEMSLFSRVQKIYDSVDSPLFREYSEVSNELSISKVPNSREIIKSLVFTQDHINGIRTQLYPFQRRSLAKMLEKETEKLTAVSPNYVKLTYVTSDIPFFYDLQSGRIVFNPEIYKLPKGGILAENMGLGKTLICLALVCITKFDISKIPEDIMLYDESESDVEEVSPGEFNSISNGKHKIRNLVDICVGKISNGLLPWKYFLNDLPESVVLKLKQSPGLFKIPTSDQNVTSRRNSVKLSKRNILSNQYRKLYLCSATLIVVPENLFHQWHNEIRKHVLIGFLNVLLISNQFKKPIHTEFGLCSNILYDPKLLLEYDVVLVSSSIFAKSFSEVKSKNILTELYWKRLIIDEGHSVSSKSSRVSLLCKSLYAERVWAVTGTPTSGLTKLFMDEDMSSSTTTNFKKKEYSITSKYNAKEDLNKLGLIIANFLKLEPYFSQPKVWNNSYIKPLMSGTFGYEMSMVNLLNNIVIRHNLKDINCDINLPQLHHQPVFLRPSYHNTISINLFTSVLAVNAISSERTDIDYMFHPTNRQRLRRLITNLQRATFHWTGFKQEDVESLIHVSEQCLKKTKEDGTRYYNSRDTELLKKSIEASKVALNNSRWRSMSLMHEMNYFVHGLPKIFTNYFSIGMVTNGNQSNRGMDQISIFGAPHLQKAQEFFYKHRFMGMENDETVRAKFEAYAKPFWDAYWKDGIRKNEVRFNKQDVNQEFHTNLMNKINNPIDALENNSIQNPNSKPGIYNGNSSDIGFNKFLGNEDSSFNDQNMTNYSKSSFEILKNSKILGTASAKLSYLGSRLLEHKHQNIKSIVFFEFEDSAYYLAELLDILGLKYILYATFIPPAERAKNLAEFTNYESEDKGGICLIMDLRLSAHGLTIIAATRVYFLNPVWKKSIEAQAIKRAHRIGQRNDVFVETLLLEGTLEEEIYKNRTPDNFESLEQVESADDKFVIDNTGMQDFVLKHNFLDFNSEEDEYTPFVSPALSSQALVTNSNSDYSLFNHIDDIYTTKETVYRRWVSYVFSEENISKYNDLNLRPEKGHLEDYLELESKKRAINKTDPSIQTRLSPKKKVRF